MILAYLRQTSIVAMHKIWILGITNTSWQKRGRRRGEGEG